MTEATIDFLFKLHLSALAGLVIIEICILPFQVFTKFRWHRPIMATLWSALGFVVVSAFVCVILGLWL